jgi:hypothetical protein
VLVHAVRAIAMLILAAGSLGAQSTAAPPAADSFEISDNSFLVEEAFNQEAGIFQNIFGLVRLRGTAVASFTQEWPVLSQAHQFSYTVSLSDVREKTGVGDTLLNYRYQALTEGSGRPAFSPRVSLVLPSGSAKDALGNGSLGLQVNLPFSKQTGDWYWHWNAGLTWLPGADAAFRQGDLAIVRHDGLTSPFLAGSGIYRLRPMLHLMLESVLSFDQSIEPIGTARETTFTLSPGFRGGWNIGDKQLIVGLALPTSWNAGASTGALVYFSYELPFRKGA